MHTETADPDVLAKFARAVNKVEAVRRDQTAKVKTFSYSYVDINSILHMLRPVLAGEGLALAQPIETDGATMTVTALIIDTDTGGTVEFPGPSFPAKGDPQSIGSAITYFRRYALVSLFALEAVDDDGSQAQQAATKPKPTHRSPQEAEIRETLAGLPDEQRREIVAAFKTEFGSGLSDLPESKHADALAFVFTRLDQEGI